MTSSHNPGGSTSAERAEWVQVLDIGGSCSHLSVNIRGGEISPGFPGHHGVVFFIEPDLDVIWKNVLSQGSFIRLQRVVGRR